jgi:molybdopterin-guanine dinucleotide biosynthesis protein MobB
MNRIHVIGRKNHGKTTLVVELVQEFTRRGLKVGTIKHTHHHHELDAPGKDSHRHREAGAALVGVLARSMSAVFRPYVELERDESRYGDFEPLFAACDVVLVEGDSQTSAPKIEVWRRSVGTAPIAAEDAAVLAIVSDDDPPAAVPVLPRSSVRAVADWIAVSLGLTS